MVASSSSQSTYSAMWINALFLLTILILLANSVSGCASPRGDYRSEAERHVASGDWDQAYTPIEYALGSDNAAVRLWSYDLLMANPGIRVAAAKSFSKEAVDRVFAKYDPITTNDLETYRLSQYEKFASNEEVDLARRNILSAFDIANAPRLALLEARKADGSSLLVTQPVFDQLSPEDQGKLKTLYPQMHVVPKDGVGKVVSSQVIDRSQPGSKAGSQLGSLLGQAAYIDRSIPGRNYSVMGQVGAGLIGAALGSTLNARPEEKYLINYGVLLSDGAVKSVLASSADSVAAPAGQCVFVVGVQEAPPYLCGDTLLAFIERSNALAVRKGSAERPANKTGVKCKLPVGTLTITAEECGRLKGEVAEK